MKTNKLYFYILLTISFQLFIIDLTFSALENQSVDRIKSLDCKSIDNKTIKFDFCYAKSYSRKITTLNIKFTLHKVMHKPFYFQYILSRRSNGNVCQNMFTSDLVEICDLMDGVDTNPMIKNVVLLLNETAPTLLHKCPYEGETTVTNVTIEPAKALVFFPSGTYCSEFNFFNNKKKQIANVRMIQEIKNNKDILGIILKKDL